MKTVTKVLAIVTALLCVAMFVFGVFGYSTKYGDITTTVVNGVSALELSSDFTNSVTAGFKSADGAALTAAELDAIAESFRGRLAYFTVIADYDVRVDYADETVWVTVPNNGYASYIFTYLTYNYGFEVHSGTEQTESTLIFDANGIKGVTPHSSQSSSSSSVSYSIELKLTSDAKQAYNDAVESLLGEAEASGSTQYISYWFNDSLLSSAVVKKGTSNGSLTVSSGVTSSNLQQMMVLLNSTPLPLDVTASRVYQSGAVLGENSAKIMWIALLAAFGAMAAWMIVKYRLGGVATAICTLGVVGGVAATLTGFINGYARPFGYATLVGCVCVVMVGIAACLHMCKRVKAALPSKSGTERAVSMALSSSLGANAAGYAVCAIIGLVLMLFTAPDGLLYSALEQSLVAGYLADFAYFGRVLFFGSLIGAAFVVVGMRLMLNAFANTAAFKSAALYGGVE